ncbi:uncharacterized protein PpBr36_09469 [Pyricularia pennisetigena]|uniref:uncharacterized protein n=1 Tax=Pyricularia pennisetigena TaxID=1578925 RepID=UPI001152F00E|nr:uncharacterized protein PpBr36_09469 [Pyricularia pennisetigena]TLS21667.1 hypothetical protein PpBr36_09469 [Pyricularia pennisetigena]
MEKTAALHQRKIVLPLRLLITPVDGTVWGAPSSQQPVTSNQQPAARSNSKQEQQTHQQPMSRYIYSSTSSYWRDYDDRGGYDSDEHRRHRDSNRRRRDKDQDARRRDHSDFHRDPLGVMAEGIGKFVKKSFGVGDSSRSKKGPISWAYGGYATSKSDLSGRRHEDDCKDRARASRRSSREYAYHDDVYGYPWRSTDRISRPWSQYGEYHHHQQYHWVDNQYGYPTAATNRTSRMCSTSHAWMPQMSGGYYHSYWRPSRGEPEYYFDKERRRREKTQTPPVGTDGRYTQSGSKHSSSRAKRRSTSSTKAEMPPMQADGQQSGSRYRYYRVKHGARFPTETEQPIPMTPTTPTTPKKVRFEGIHVHSDLSD